MRAWHRIAGLVFLSACGGALPEGRVIPPATMVAEGYSFPDLGPAHAPPAAPPLSLTASDGTGLTLAALEARAIIEDPLAFTELHLTFDNPEDRRLEGTFGITLPEGAALSRFAMKIGEAWQEGEVVEKKAAREAYEDFLHRKQDPALLEQAEGNRFSARVFPIPARGRKEIIVSYSQEITNGKPWSLPLRGLPKLGRLEVEVTLASPAEQVATLGQTNVTPTADYTLDPKLFGRAAGLRHGNLMVARVRPFPDAEPDPLGPTIVLVDTSASRALGFEEETRLVDALVRRIAASAGAKTPVLVACFDQTADAIFEGEAGSWGEGDVRRMRTRQAFGASDLGRALGFAEAHAVRGYKRVLLVGDGVATAGETSAAAIGARAAKLGGAGVERLDVIAVGGIRDEATLKKLATAGLPRDGVVADAAIGSEAIAARLSLRTRSGIPVEVEGARWSWPTRLDGVQAGDEVLVYADVPEGTPVRVRVGDRTGPALDLVPVARPLLARSFAKAKIASLLELKGSEPSPSLVREVIALSTKNRVLSPYTSLLVLETDQDFARFSLDRKALADILTVDGGKLAVVNRKPPRGDERGDDGARVADRKDTEARGNGAPRIAPPPPGAAPAAGERMAARPAATAAPDARPAPPSAAAADPLAARGNMWGDGIGDSFGAGGLGLTGVGEGGSGHGEGIGLGRVGTLGHGAGTGRGQGASAARGATGASNGGVSGGVSGGQVGGVLRGAAVSNSRGRVAGSHTPAVPEVSASAPAVSGSLSTETIQGVIRRHLPRIRRCYEASLADHPGQGGRVAVRFTIGPRGGPATVAIESVSGLDERTTTCIKQAFFAMSFPPPESGTITVTYPFIFSPGDGTPPPSGQRVVLPALDVPPSDEAPGRARAWSRTRAASRRSWTPSARAARGPPWSRRSRGTGTRRAT
ncbi:MAG: VIT domain-containing protein [Minicystis sp.]